MVVCRNSCNVAEGVPVGGRAPRGDGGGGESADPGDTDPEEHGVEPPQYLKQKPINFCSCKLCLTTHNKYILLRFKRYQKRTTKFTALPQ